MGEIIAFTTECRNECSSICKRINLALHIKVNSKWIIDINIKPKMIKFLEENFIGGSLD